MRIFNTASLTEASALSLNERAWVYNGLDCCVTYEVHEALHAQLDNVSSSTYGFSLDLQGPVAEMMLRGTLINQNERIRAIAEFSQERDRLAGFWNRICEDGIGVPCKWSSPKQLANLFFGVLGLPEKRKKDPKTDEWRPTTGEEALLELASVYLLALPLVNIVLRLRELGKKISFLETKLDPDNRIRANFNIAGTSTGRLSSSQGDFGTGTNTQNIDPTLRSVFVAEPGRKFCNIDLEQADSRNVGAICWELFHASHGPAWAGAYLDACESGDLHTQVARLVWPDMPWTGDRVADRKLADEPFYRHFSRRDACKRLGHGSNYLGQPATMAAHTKIGLNLVREFQASYFAAFPCVPEWHKWVDTEVNAFGRITTLFGRRRWVLGRRDAPATLRELVAYAPQSMTGDELNIGLLRVFREGSVYLHNQVHDSILFSYPEQLENELIPHILKLMEVHVTLQGGRDFFVPLEAKVGWTWGDRQLWTEDDVRGKKCSREMVGRVKKNPDGLIKWKGSDSRERTLTRLLG